MNIKQQLGNTDIYLVDQILKGRYTKGKKILDAGCGGGRNLQWFTQNDFEVYGVDRSIKFITVHFLKTATDYTDFHGFWVAKRPNPCLICGKN